MNLPPPPNAIQLETRKIDDIKIYDIEDGETEESQPRHSQNQNNVERNEKDKSDYDVRKLNSIPNSQMMLNIAALIMVMIFTLTNCVRLYQCDDRSVKYIRLIKVLYFLLLAKCNPRSSEKNFELKFVL